MHVKYTHKTVTETATVGLGEISLQHDLVYESELFYFLVAPTHGSVLPLRSIGLSFLSFLI
jgi:hypothetical protein